MTLHPFLQLLADAGVYSPAEHLSRPTNGHSSGSAVPPPGDPDGQRYAAGALRSEAERVATTPEGGRNHALNAGAFRMGQLSALGYITPETVREALAEAAEHCGLPPGEADATIRSGLGAGTRSTREVTLRSKLESPVVMHPPVDHAQPSDLGADRARSGAERSERDSDGGLPQPLDWVALWAESADDEPDWLVPEILERGRSHVLYAPHKIGKSLLTQVLCGQMAAITTLYLDFENSRADIRERFRDMGYRPEQLGHLHYFSFPSMSLLDTPAGGATLFALVKHYGAELVVLDTTARVVGGKENDSDTYRDLYRYSLVPLKAQGVAILRLDHAGKDPATGQRGSSAKGDDVDAIWLLLRHDETRYQLKCDAQRSGHHPQTIDLIKCEDPLRFERSDDPFSRPEETALLDALDRLGVPEDAGRIVARDALTRAGFKLSSAALGNVLRVRKARLTSWTNRSGSGPEKLIMPKIDSGDPQDQLDFSVTPGQTAPGAVADRGDREGAAQGRAPLRGAPPLKGGARSGAPGLIPDRPPDSDPPAARLCDRCRLTAEHLSPGTRGQLWCRSCAYPDPSTRPGIEDDPQEEN